MTQCLRLIVSIVFRTYSHPLCSKYRDPDSIGKTIGEWHKKESKWHSSSMDSFWLLDYHPVDIKLGFPSDLCNNNSSIDLSRLFLDNQNPFLLWIGPINCVYDLFMIVVLTVLKSMQTQAMLPLSRWIWSALLILLMFLILSFNFIAWILPTQ
jgi:hypothetical protein